MARMSVTGRSAKEWLWFTLIASIGVLGKGVAAQVPCGGYEVAAIIEAPSCGSLGKTPTLPAAISPDGNYVCGWTLHCVTGDTRGFIYNVITDQFIPLVHPPGVFESELTDINNSGIAVGQYTTQQGYRGFVYDLNSGQYIELPGWTADSWSYANAINSQGTVVGIRGTTNGGSGGPFTAFRWTLQNGFTDLLIGDESNAQDMADDGTIVGYTVDRFVKRAHIWTEDDSIDLGTLAGMDTIGSAISESNLIVGRGAIPHPNYPFGLMRPWYLGENGLVELPILDGDIRGGTSDVRNGLIVGWSRSSNNVDRPVVWFNDAVHNVIELCDMPIGYMLRACLSIADSGALLVYATAPAGSLAAVLLMPADKLPGDITGDCATDVLDLLAVIDAWGDKSSPADLNQDKVVNAVDLLIVISNWTG